MWSWGAGYVVTHRSKDDDAESSPEGSVAVIWIPGEPSSDEDGVPCSVSVELLNVSQSGSVDELYTRDALLLETNVSLEKDQLYGSLTRAIRGS